MTYLKLAGLAAATALLLTMSLSGTASGTILCETSGNPCANEGYYDVGTMIESTLKSGTKSVLKMGVNTAECSESTLGVEETNHGGGTTEVVGSVSTLTFGSCSCTMTVLKKGIVAVAWTSGTNNGNVSGEGTEVHTVCGGITCNYGGLVKEHFTLEGGASAVWKAAEAVLIKQEGSFLCSTTAKWSAEYAVSKPSPLDVEETLTDPTLKPASPTISFKGSIAGAIKNIKVKNEGPVVATLGKVAGAQLVEENGKQAEGNFRFLTNGSCKIPLGELNKGSECTVPIEFVSGTAGIKATYTLRYGSRVTPESQVASITLES
ncbi:MAG: hypothetical protein ACTHK3_07560 [Solirubrobacterales bacterium]